MNRDFKVNDWCFCEFELQQIKDIKEGRITGVSNGFMSHSGHDLSDRCYPLDLKIKVASDSVKYWSDKFHALKTNSLNHPDLNRKLISLWVDICESIKDDELLKAKYKALEDFGRAVMDKVSNLRYEQVDDVKLFTR